MTAWHEYAEGVKNGKITACKRLKQAVKRYFSDLENPFTRSIRRSWSGLLPFPVCPHVKGAMRGSPIELEPWQQFAFACILGFKVKATGRRKYTSAFIEVPRKNAKSTVAAILANWFLVMENGQQDIYTAAVSRDQARIVFDDARQMCLLSRPLRKRVNIQAHKVIHPKTNSLLKPLAAKAATIEGTNPSLAIVDEYHLHPDNGVYSALELGMGARPEGLLFAITTSGSNVVSACKQHYDYCCQILDGEEVNESMFVLIYELDDESEVDDPAMWIKANPNIDVSVDREKLASTIQKARGIPSQWVEMLTKRFNIWCQGLRRGWVTVHGRSAPERSRRWIYTGRSATRGWTYHQPAIFPACAMPSWSVKRLCWFHVTIYRNFSYRTPPIKTAPSIASG